MQSFHIEKIKKSEHRHAPEVSKQTGFPSPATHYLEPTISLDQELIGNTDATFFVRINGNQFSGFNVHDRDVLIVDRSLTPKRESLVLAIRENDFELMRFKGEKQGKTIFVWGVITYVIHHMQ